MSAKRGSALIETARPTSTAPAASPAALSGGRTCPWDRRAPGRPPSLSFHDADDRRIDHRAVEERPLADLHRPHVERRPRSCARRSTRSRRRRRAGPSYSRRARSSSANAPWGGSAPGDSGRSRGATIRKKPLPAKRNKHGASPRPSPPPRAGAPPWSAWVRSGCGRCWRRSAWLTGDVPPFLLDRHRLHHRRHARARRPAAAPPGPLAAGPARPPAAWALGLGAFFGYHALYFTTLRLLPPVEALLIINLWPLLIVLLSALLPGDRLLPRHVLGGPGRPRRHDVDRAFARRRQRRGRGAAPLGYASAVACALIWSGYSVAQDRRVAGEVSSEAVTGFCLGTAILALLMHVLVEGPGRPVGAAWIAVLALGAGPVGAAFFLWDIGTKRGALQVLGAAAYLAPLISALLLMAMGRSEPSWRLAAAAALIIGGAVIAGRAQSGRDPASATA